MWGRVGWGVLLAPRLPRIPAEAPISREPLDHLTAASPAERREWLLGRIAASAGSKLDLAADDGAPGAVLDEIDLTGGEPVDLHGADLRGVRLRRAKLARVDLRGADLRGAQLGQADLRRAKLDEADLRDADLVGADLRGASLETADLRGATIEDAKLRRARLRFAKLDGAVLEGADLRGADLWGASGRELEAPGANLRGATLREADFRGADLSGAVLRGAPSSARRPSIGASSRGLPTSAGKTPAGVDLSEGRPHRRPPPGPRTSAAARRAQRPAPRRLARPDPDRPRPTGRLPGRGIGRRVRAGPQGLSPARALLPGPGRPRRRRAGPIAVGAGGWQKHEALRRRPAFRGRAKCKRLWGGSAAAAFAGYANYYQRPRCRRVGLATTVRASPGSSGRCCSSTSSSRSSTASPAASSTRTPERSTATPATWRSSASWR